MHTLALMGSLAFSLSCGQAFDRQEYGRVVAVCPQEAHELLVLAAHSPGHGGDAYYGVAALDFIQTSIAARYLNRPCLARLTLQAARHLDTYLLTSPTSAVVRQARQTQAIVIHLWSRLPPGLTCPIAERLIHVLVIADVFTGA